MRCKDLIVTNVQSGSVSGIGVNSFIYSYLFLFFIYFHFHFWEQCTEETEFSTCALSETRVNKTVFLILTIPLIHLKIFCTPSYQ